MTKNLTVRASEAWLQYLDSAIEAMSPGLDLDRSKGVRHLLDRHSFLMVESPYIIRRMAVTVLVGGNGDMAYHSQEEILLSSRRERLPCSIEMKPEKILDYAKRVGSERRLAGSLRDRWLLNYFAAYRDSQLLADHCDGVGLTRKQADLELNLPQDTVVQREMVVVNEDYVQRAEDGDRSDDRSEILMVAPTFNLSLSVMVDLDVYGASSLRDEAGLDYELRNGEGALLQARRYLYGDNPLTWIAGRPPISRKSWEETHKSVRDSVERLVTRVGQLSTQDKTPGSKEPLFHSDSAKARLAQFAAPTGPYLFGRLTWPYPPMGIDICTTWNKPPEQAAFLQRSSRTATSPS